ncbi:MAG: hypothetical protein KAI79_14585 [Bacteroidales bacterium]|nr:hypothetical protein [Bacteroidales bacterium]
MTIQNKFKAAKYSLLIRITLGVIALLILLIVFMPSRSSYKVVEGFIVLLGLLYLALLVKMPHYFLYSDFDKNYIVLRYYNIHPLLVKPKQLQIPKGSISDIKIVSLFWGWRKILTISVKSEKTAAYYPSINVSLLSEAEIEKLRSSLAIWKKQ